MQPGVSWQHAKHNSNSRELEFAGFMAPGGSALCLGMDLAGGGVDKGVNQAAAASWGWLYAEK